MKFNKLLTQEINQLVKNIKFYNSKYKIFFFRSHATRKEKHNFNCFLYQFYFRLKKFAPKQRVSRYSWPLFRRDLQQQMRNL